MGVTGLWRLVEPTGKPVPVETLENKVLAVDISIWLHQVVKGYQDAKGAPLPNAHLMGLFQRLCKLLYFRIKPVFVFDGAFPDLKKETIAKRQDTKSKYHSESERLKRELAMLLSKKSAVTSLLGKQISPKKTSLATVNDDDIFKLPALPENNDVSESDSDDEDTSSGSIVDLHSVDLESENFKKLDVKEKYDLLIELKETRKMNSWGKLHELPKKSNTFSDFQLQRLLKRRKVQECLEETEKEMGTSGMSLNQLESLLNEEGIDTKIESIPTRRIASNDTTRFLLIKNVKKALEDARQQKSAKINEEIASTSSTSNIIEMPVSEKKDELEEDLQKAIKMSLECVDEQNTSVATSNKTDDSWTSHMTDSDYSITETDSEDLCGYEEPDMSSAKAYIMQYSDFTYNTINKIIEPKRCVGVIKEKVPKVSKILEELDKETSVIVDKIDLLSDDEKEQSNTETADIKIEKLDSDDCALTAMDDQNYEVDDLNSEKPLSLCAKVTKSEIVPTNSVSENTKSKSCEQQATTIATEDLNNVDVMSESSDDDEFEEVTETEVEAKPVVELILNMGVVPEDDIFADVFLDNKTIKGSALESELSESIEETIKEDKHPTFVTVVNTEERKNLELERFHHHGEKSIDEDSKTINQSHSLGNKNNLLHEKSNVQVSGNFAQKTVNSIHFNKEEISSAMSEISVNEQLMGAGEQYLNNINHAVKISKDPIKSVTPEQLNILVEDIQTEEQNLLQEKGRLDRIGRNITEQMTKDAQELLQIFGIPYIVAPMEAEAQCAFLESVNLTDGTITDDSDIWLFGGRTVYKNFFNQKKHVLQFLSERIEKSFNLTREQLILLALLVGSDYTTGLNGVGPVTALEILASFPYNKKVVVAEKNDQARYLRLMDGLLEFKKWIRSGRKTDNTSLKKKLKNVTITEDFPSIRVIQAYLEPKIEKSKENFTWGDLDITVLRDYTKEKFGWSQSKLDEIITPVLKRIQERQKQKTLQHYFKRKIEFHSLEDQMSKRVKAAVKKMGPEIPQDLQDVAAPAQPKAKRKRKVVKTDVSMKNNTLSNVSESCRESNSKSKIKPSSIVEESIERVVKVKTINDEVVKSPVEIKIKKLDRFQEFIPQREKDKQGLLQNKMKAIEIFRKTKLDPKKQNKKRRVLLPKNKAELSESSDSN